MLPSTLEDYLEAILTITENGERSATLDEIAAALDSGKEVAGTTIASLVEEGYLERTDGDAVRLTGKGLSVASQVARKHHVLQCFLTEMLGVDADAANKEACTLEHGISDETIDRLSSYMDGARSPPGRLGRCRGWDCTLLDCKEGDTVRVAMMRGPRRHRRLLDLGIFPGEIVQIRRKLPNQSVVVRVKGCDIAISPEIARSIIVESCP
ncbi:metal-dependent transcriptional regulator [Methanoculleus sp. YWC-01]|jgi:DtxR family Mn-dependent transcriptional regulator|uniref:Metal-dependent transcriptional regulator n=1 Tax=Methanoculleus nereidis TaxID=2735141 RepID=A0ABU3Z5L0_9EURY|nr:metal-dependent transcriptional regulator [Methanoculleus sp. YWC-01]MCK9306380.1 metal-dependent transcriptional regulator [Methanoculleus sp.]MDV4344089.1 metal-dependent transcriptional regulator [Methanoculleus sp. YWC-01]PKL56485.1 MAG: metal-dependent transcriptional regulator [Methanomicrobiales archaeon HGW-Methanomicrobiales-6]